MLASALAAKEHKERLQMVQHPCTLYIWHSTEIYSYLLYPY